MLLKKTHTINCGGTLLNFSTPCVMGILNVTPDSFFDGGKYIEAGHIEKQVENMLSAGVGVLDIGAASSRPGSTQPSTAAELGRLLPAIKLVRSQFKDIIISADTCNYEVAKEALDAGAHMINDISGGNENMYKVIAAYQVPYILMHMQGTTQTMQINPHYNDVVLDVMNYFNVKLSQLREFAIHDIILDVGFGFGKTVAYNYELLGRLKSFEIFDLPILAGVSRKAMINKILHTSPENALNGTTVLNTIALLNGASVLRVHDVKEALECVKLVNALQKVNQELY